MNPPGTPRAPGAAPWANANANAGANTGANTGAGAGAEAAARNILVVEDERDIAELIALHLSDLPARVTLASDGLSGRDLALQRRWHAIVLDIRLPGLNGLDLCRELRARLSAVPILMLTARSAELDRVLGLELGADDYLTKPFSVIELQARVKALLRRSALTSAALAEAQSHKPSVFVHGSLSVDRLQRRTWLAGHEVTLAPREFDLLWHFVQHPGRVFTRTELLDEVWGHSHDGYDHTVNSHINRLRSKLDGERTEPGFIHTVWGVGYRFEAKA